MQIPLEELEKVKYLDLSDLAGRYISTMTFYDEGEWHMWIPTGNKLIKIQGQPAEAFYFSKEKQKDDDLYFHCLSFLAQRASFPTTNKALWGLKDDFHNLGASLAKLNYFYTQRKELENGLSRLVATEIEYIFSVCRSIFDLIQEVIAKLWKTVTLINSDVPKGNLPETFSRAVLESGRPREPGQYREKYGLPQELDDFYCKHVDFFVALREFRDSVAHRGTAMESIFCTEKGFAVREDQRPFNMFPIWDTDHQQKNNLCSLRPAIGFFIQRTLIICDEFTRILEHVIKFPNNIAPNMHLFMRGYFGSYILENNKVVENCSWWDT